MHPDIEAHLAKGMTAAEAVIVAIQDCMLRAVDGAHDLTQDDSEFRNALKILDSFVSAELERRISDPEFLHKVCDELERRKASRS